MKNLFQYLLLLIIAIAFGHFWGTNLGKSDLAFYGLGILLPVLSVTLLISPAFLLSKLERWLIYSILGILNLSCAFLINYFIERSLSLLYVVVVAGVLVFSFVRVWQFSKAE